jgi:hypothetical protein
MPKEPMPSFIQVPANAPASAAKLRAENNRQAHCEQWSQSGLSMSEYCRRHHLSISSLSLWVKRMNPNHQPVQQLALTPAPKKQCVEIHLSNGVHLLFSEIIDPAAMVQLVKAFLACN